jgi:hypothetical protein
MNRVPSFVVGRSRTTIMKWTALLVAFFLFPALARADALAEGVFVLDRATYDGLVRESSEISKVPTEALARAAASFGLLSDSYAASFKVKDQAYRVLASRQEKRTIYSISRIVEGKPPHLVCVGTVAAGDQVKVELRDDSLVVVLRIGNFLKK